MTKKHGRHTSAFLLLFLSDSPSYGALLLAKLETELPHSFSDSGDVYRCLQDMNKNGLVEVNWETQETGQPRKWYTITPKGIQALKVQAEDICLRYANFEFFLTQYENIVKKN